MVFRTLLSCTVALAIAALLPAMLQAQQTVVDLGSTQLGAPATTLFSQATTPVACGNTYRVERFSLRVAFRTGEDHDLGLSDPAARLRFKVIGLALNNTTVFEQGPFELNLALDRPEQVIELDLSPFYQQTHTLRVVREDTPNPGFAAASTHLPFVNARITLDRRVSFAPIANTNCALMPAGVTNAGAQSNQVTLQWSTNNQCPCPAPYTNYEVQLVRLYNRSAALTTEQHIETTVDWSQAMTLETGTPQNALTLTLAEGTGFYAWRVRAISNFVPGGGADARNRGPWNPAAAQQNAVVNVQRTSALGTGLWQSNAYGLAVFYYEQFDKDRNWAYSRMFTEPDPDGIQGVRIGERITYATDLQQVQQEQVRQSANNTVVATQTVMDLQGRPALQSLPTPLGQQPSLGYKNQLLQGSVGNYTAADFDLPAGTLGSNTPINAGPTTYYSNSGDPQVPSAEGYPFSRTTYLPDGTGRVRQVSGPGEVFAFANNATPRTARTYYGAVTPAELLRIFGKEAYQAQSVMKMMTVDPNGVTSITYQDKEGKTLATCLVRTTAPNLPLDDDSRRLVGLESEQYANEEEAFDVNGGVVVDNYMLDAGADLLIPGNNTAVTLSYTLTPDQVEACPNYCATCDYTIEYYLVRTDCPAENLIPETLAVATWPTPLTLANLDCSAAAGTVPSLNHTVTLNAGSYKVGRRIRVNNVLDDNDPAFPGWPALQAHQQTLREAYTDAMLTTVAPLLTALDNADLDAFYASNLVTDLGNDQVQIALECASINLPKLECPPCVIDADTLLRYFISAYNEAIDPDLPTDLNNLPATFWSDHFSYPISGDPTAVYTYASFSQLMYNMLNIPATGGAPYDCEKIWGCWIGAVQGYTAFLAAQNSPNPITPGSVPGAATLPGYNPATPLPQQYLVDLFLDCAGRRTDVLYSTAGSTHTPLQFSSTQGYLTNAYQGLSDDVVGSDCHLFLASLQPFTSTQGALMLDPPSLNGTPLTPGVAFAEPIIMDPANPGVLTTGYDLLMGCLAAEIDLNAAPLTPTQIQDQADQIVAACTTACFSTQQEAAFRQAVIAEYGLQPESSAGANDNDEAAIDCLVLALQNTCVSACNTVQAQGSPVSSIGPPEALITASLIGAAHPVVDGVPCNNQDPQQFQVNNLCIPTEVCLHWVPEVAPATPPDPSTALSCEAIHAQALRQELLAAITMQVEQLVDQFAQDYMSRCAVPANIQDNLHVSFASGKHHYTLYYYDRAGNLMSTVPPNDEDKQLDHAGVPEANWPNNVPAYDERTQYRYNSLGQLVWQRTPDGGATTMAYDRLGRLRFSQNAKQAAYPTPTYSYTRYDELGRVIEVGESNLAAATVLTDPALANDNSFPAAGKFVTRTTYTAPLAGLTFPNGQPQRNLVNRVSWTVSDEDGDLFTTHDQVLTAYSYDVHGNVAWLVHQLPGLGRAHVAYDYDLVSGRVRQLRYNEGFTDQYFQRYTYDADGRILTAQTSTDGVLWDRDATYSYYAHGPLRRTLLGEDKVQGIDHTYTIQGWLKAINAPELTNLDPGADSFAGTNSTTGRDAFGMMLSYFNGDFNDLNSPFHNTSGNGRVRDDLYNGNIGAWSWQAQTAEANQPPQPPFNAEDRRVMRYRYDVLNRLKADRQRDLVGGQWTDGGLEHATSYAYDANGNFVNDNLAGGQPALKRFDLNGNPLDAIAYAYGDPNGPNRLTSISESINGAGDDLAETHTYTYDAIGQLEQETWNNQGNTISWTPYGKVHAVALSSGRHLRFAYDAAGHRVMKADVSAPGSGITQAPVPGDVFTYYVLDAQGNPLATYRRTFDNTTGQLLDETRLEEHLIYGSARLGTHRDNPVVRRSVWDGAQQRELPTLLTPKAELERLDVPSRVAKLRAGEILTPSSNYTYTRTYATSPTVPAIPAMTAQHTVVGTGCTNVHRAEDRQGNRLFATIATSQVVNGSTVHTLYLLDRNGDVLWNSQGIRAAANTVTHSCQVPGSPNKHYLFTIGPDGRPYIHLIDLSITAITQGAVVLKNVPLDNDPASVDDRALAVVDDRTAYGRTMLYAVRRQGTDYTLMGLDLEALTQNGGGLLAPLAPPLTGSDQAQQGLLQLRPDGAELAFVTADGPLLLNTLWAPTVTVHRYALSPDHLAASYLGAYDEVDAAIHYLDYAPGTQYLYFVRTGLTFGTATHEVKRLDLATNTADVITGEGGDIRRTKHGDMLVATPAWAYNQGEAFLIKDPNDPAPTFAWDFFSQPDARGEAAIGLQPLVYELLPATSTRSLNQKRYELADHLGNVRAVVSDRKLCDNAALPTPPTAYRAEVLNQTDYFPFGMISNATTASGGDYRFGFNGKEKDDEIFGSNATSYDFGSRLLDVRIGRWSGIDPKARLLPHYSPYHFAKNSPLQFVDPDGQVVQGGNQQSFARLQLHVQTVFTGYDALKALFQQQAGTHQFAPISEADFLAAVKDISDPNVRALANGYFEAVNSQRVYTFMLVHNNTPIAEEEGYAQATTGFELPYEIASGKGSVLTDSDDSYNGGDSFQGGGGNNSLILFNEEGITSKSFNLFYSKDYKNRDNRNGDAAITRGLLGSFYGHSDPFIARGGDAGIARQLTDEDMRVIRFQLENMTRDILRLVPFDGAGNTRIPDTRNDEVLKIPGELKLNIYMGNPRTLDTEKVTPKGK
ncbi:MAG: hypothetical protein JNL05_04280 [Flavobacteriales bacterium]|nr:hypothetical protein [Flavobacteriales bacterium]